MNIITIELCAEDRARLDRIISGLEAVTGAAPASNPDQVTMEEVIAEVTLSDIQRDCQGLRGAGNPAAKGQICRGYGQAVRFGLIRGWTIWRYRSQSLSA